jgi:hypothetical protein
MATKKTENQVKVAMAKVEAAKKAEAAKVVEEKKAPAKTTAAKAAAPAKKAEEPKAAAKTATKTTTAKKTTTTKAAPAKKAAAKKTTATKTTAKKAAPAKKATAKTSETVHLQVFQYDITTEAIKAKVVEAVGKKSVKELNIYVKPEEGKVYYTADGEQGSVEL